MRSGYVPRQQLCYAVDGMVSDVGEGVSEIVLRVDPVELGCAEERVDRGGGVSPPGLEPANKYFFLPSATTRSAPFGGVVVDLDGAVIEISCERRPTRERVTDCSGHIALGGESLKRLIAARLGVLP